MAEEKSSCRTEIYYPDGRVLVMEWEEGTCPGYEWLVRAVGGYLESVSRFLIGAESPVLAFCDEEGGLKRLDVNVSGMKALNWPEPPQGWEAYEHELEVRGKKVPLPDAPLLITSETQAAEVMAALQRWSPVSGPVVILWGWSPTDLDEKEALNPESLGEPRA